MLLGPIISRLFTCSNEEKNIKNKTKGTCSSPISMGNTHNDFTYNIHKCDINYNGLHL